MIRSGYGGADTSPRSLATSIRRPLETLLARRSNLPLALGILALIIGAALVLLVVKNDDDSDGGSSRDRSSRDATVYVAVKKLSPGASGGDLVSDKAVEARNIPTTERAADAITQAVQLDGMILTAEVAVGQQLRLSHFRSSTVRSSAIDIPAGMQAVAVQVPFVPGVAGYVGPDDKVNVYGVIKGAAIGQNVKLVLSGVEVIDVSTEVAPRRGAADPAASRAAGQQI